MARVSPQRRGKGRGDKRTLWQKIATKTKSGLQNVKLKAAFRSSYEVWIVNKRYTGD
jgi:hypothetical protein